MTNVQKSGIALAVAGAILVISRLLGVAQGQQTAIGIAFLLVGAVMYVVGRSSG